MEERSNLSLILFEIWSLLFHSRSKGVTVCLTSSKVYKNSSLLSCFPSLNLDAWVFLDFITEVLYWTVFNLLCKHEKSSPSQHHMCTPYPLLKYTLVPIIAFHPFPAPGPVECCLGSGFSNLPMDSLSYNYTLFYNHSPPRIALGER